MDDPKYREMIQFLKDLGTDNIPHSGKPFMAHLISVFNDLKRWGADQDICRAGLFHSIYGTQEFQGFCLSTEQRDKVKELIGERAEWIAFLNCFLSLEYCSKEIISVLVTSLACLPINMSTYKLLPKFL